MKPNRAIVGLLPLVMLACRTASAETGSSPSDALVGTWRLLSFTRTIVATGETADLFGKSPTGYITYGSDGRMQVIIVKEGRPKLDPARVTDAQRADLFKTLIAYAGTYRFDGKTVTHHIEASWNESWTGTDQQRDVQIEGKRVTLTTRPSPSPMDGAMTTARLVWERLEPANR